MVDGKLNIYCNKVVGGIVCETDNGEQVDFDVLGEGLAVVGWVDSDANARQYFCPSDLPHVGSTLRWKEKPNSCIAESSVALTIVQVKRVQLGDSIVEIKIQDTPGPAKDFTFISLHDNENTAPKAARKFLEKHGGRFIEISHKGTRCINFRMPNGKKYSFDPNRIFTDEGIRHSIEHYSNKKCTDEILELVKNFREEIFNSINDSKYVIAVHNNSGTLKATSFSRNRNTEKIYTGDESKLCDFFLVTHNNDFNKLKFFCFNQNIVLQRTDFHSEYEKDVGKGSLSEFYANSIAHYINCETVNGSLKKQMELLEKMYLTFSQVFAEESR